MTRIIFNYNMVLLIELVNYTLGLVIAFLRITKQYCLKMILLEKHLARCDTAALVLMNIVNIYS